jgi:ubiquinone/menaquinone biosynthesis C-methylase UbiE
MMKSSADGAIDPVLSAMRCVRCNDPRKDLDTSKWTACGRCGAPIRVDAVAIDVVPREVSPSSLGARVMQSRSLARVYERLWRPLSFGLSTWFGAPGIDREARDVVDLFAGTAGPWLDLSCGTGGLLRRLAAAAGTRRVVGVDLSRPMLERARSAAPNALLVRADAAELPFGDATFGAIANLAALDLYADPARVIREAARVLAPGGRWVCSTFVRRGASPSARGTLSGVRTPAIEDLEDWTERAGLGRLGNRFFRGYAIAWADKE